MSFLRAAGAGVAAAALLGALLVVSGAGWEIADHMRRERLFVVALNALLCGWLAAAAVFAAAKIRRRPAADPTGSTFWAASALALAPWSWFALLPAALLLALALRGSLPAVHRGVAAAGWLLHLAPAAIYLAYPAETHVLPLRDPVPALAPAAAPGPAVSEARPDVLLVVADTLRADAILDSRTPTPTLDALRARGTWAEFALAPCNQTLPSHMVLFTGLDIEQLGMRSNESRWPLAETLRSDWRMRTVAERLRAAGWRTAGVAANVLLSSAPLTENRSEDEKEQAFDAGFEWWHGMQRVEYFTHFVEWSSRCTLLGWILPERGVAFPLAKLLNPSTHHHLRTHWQEGERTLEVALAALDQLHAQPQPAFLFVNLFDPHAPYMAPEPFRETIARPGSAPPGYAAWPEGEFDMRVAMYDAFAALRQRGAAPPPFAAESAYLRDLYREEVATTDALLGRLLKRVEQSGRPTLILFVGDHGEAFGEHHNVEHRWTLHEEELRVPFILAGPGVPAGRRLEQVPELVDGTRTLLELLGLADASVSGRNVLTTDAVAPRPAFSMMLYRASLCGGRWKLIAWVSYGEDKDSNGAFTAGAHALEPRALFDLDADPGEMRNLLESGPLAPDAAAALESLGDQVRERMRGDRFPFLPARVLNEKQRDLFAALGYADGH